MAPLTVNFTDESIHTEPIESWAWDFDGDGTVDSTEQNPTHIYTEANSYTVSLTVTELGIEDKITQTDLITVYAPVVADFSADVTIGPEPLTVHFTDRSDGTVTSWAWDFDGDGTVDSTEQDPVFEYERPGRYTVSLKVIGFNGTNISTATRENYITVQDVVTLQWDANSEEDQEEGLTGYKLYYKEDAYGETPEDFTGSTGALEGPSPIIVALDHPDLRTIDINGKKVHQFDLTGLPTDQHYFFFAVTAFNIMEDDEQESDLSQPAGTLAITSPEEEAAYNKCKLYEDKFINAERESSYTLCGRAMPGALVDIFAGDVWITEFLEEPIVADEDGHWRKEIDFTTIDQGEIALTAVSNAAGAYPVSVIHDSIAPQISVAPEVLSIGDTYAVIHWITDEPGTSVVEYGENATFGSIKSSQGLTTQHYLMLDDLHPGSAYEYQASSTDAAGNGPDAAPQDDNPAPPGSFDSPDVIEPAVVGDPYIGFNYIRITFNKPNMQGADLESSYSFSPSLAFASPGVYGEFYDVANFSGASYYLAMQSIPGYEIFTLRLSGITDVNGRPVTPNVIIINDNDGDGMADDWELDYGLDPSDPADGDPTADADGDGYSNRQEYLARSDPHSAGEVPFAVMSVLPPHEAGLVNNLGVPNDTGIAILIGSLNGIDPDSTFLRLDVTVDGELYEYSADSEAVGIRALPEDFAPPMTYYWINVDRAKDPRLDDEDLAYPFDALVDVRIEASDIHGAPMNPEEFQFKIESPEVYRERTDPAHIPDLRYLEDEDPIFTEHFDAGFEITSGDMSEVKILYSSSEEPAPLVGAPNVIPPISIANIQGLGQPLNLQPHTVFNKPVKIVLPLPAGLDPDNYAIFMFDGIEWIEAFDLNGNLSDAAAGWVVPGSIRTDDDALSELEFQVHHFSAVQGGTVVIIVQSDDGLTAGGGGGCFIETVADRGVNVGLWIGLLGVVGLVLIRRLKQYALQGHIDLE